jgi:hypothetical protein
MVQVNQVSSLLVYTSMQPYIASTTQIQCYQESYITKKFILTNLFLLTCSYATSSILQPSQTKVIKLLANVWSLPIFCFILRVHAFCLFFCWPTIQQQPTNVVKKKSTNQAQVQPIRIALIALPLATEQPTIIHTSSFS